MPLLDLTCRSCGAKLSDMPDRDRFFCPFCGALYVKEQSIVQNITNITCDSVQVSIADFEIRSGTLIKYNGSASDVVVPDTVSIIGSQAFSGTAVQTVKIPDSVHTIEAYAFSDCSALRKVDLPSSPLKIGNRAFFRCRVLKEMQLPAEVTLPYGENYPFLGTPIAEAINRQAEIQQEQELRDFRILNNLCPDCGGMLFFGRCTQCGYRKTKKRR